ncbi:hypothetical protein Droror1_Dr00012460 [Drosera rotundifolia]
MDGGWGSCSSQSQVDRWEQESSAHFHYPLLAYKVAFPSRFLAFSSSSFLHPLVAYDFPRHFHKHTFHQFLHSLHIQANISLLSSLTRHDYTPLHSNFPTPH